MAKITEFAIRNLYGYRNITIPIKNNRVVLVGVNGLGKTTIINLLYCFLSRQWQELSKYQFSEISVKIEGERIALSRNDIESELKFKTKNKKLTEVDKYLSEKIEYQLLYLPTYRRIEKELKIIFPDLDEYNILKKQESAITQFVEVCNRYLEDKNLYYDDKDYTLEIKLYDKTPLKLSMLSSGEKQIVSLFYHIYLGGEKQYIILLDEPELSLSVEWQKHFLPDILATKRCLFLAAVTHSPFIFQNELDEYAEDIREYIQDNK